MRTRLTLTLALSVGTLFAQAPDGSIDKQIQLMRQDLRSNKKKVVAANMTLTDTDATKFWPVYDQYTADLVQINNDKYALIKEAAQTDTLSDQQAEDMTRRWLALDSQVTQLRVKYIPTFRKVISAKQTALFFQIDRRVQMMIDLQLASVLPLVEP
jgi:hypothetical protein